jgi:hypothetical protein
MLQWTKDSADAPREIEAAWWLSHISFPLFLRVDERDGGGSQSNPIKDRIERFLKGEFDPLLTEFLELADEIRTRTSRDALRAPSTPEVTAGLGLDVGEGFRVPRSTVPPAIVTVRAYGRALKLCKLGRVADAVAALTPAERAPRNDVTFDALRAFFPEGGGDAFDGHHLRSLLRERDVEDAFSLEAYAETIRDAKRGKAADRFGVRADTSKLCRAARTGRPRLLC